MSDMSGHACLASGVHRRHRPHASGMQGAPVRTFSQHGVPVSCRSSCAKRCAEGAQGSSTGRSSSRRSLNAEWHVPWPAPHFWSGPRPLPHTASARAFGPAAPPCAHRHRRAWTKL
ncbi:hypothetical protein OAO87_00945 [bacterium]|nr:hypothetical protein [bacterium]